MKILNDGQDTHPGTERRRAQSKSYFWLIRIGADGQSAIIFDNYTEGK